MVTTGFWRTRDLGRVPGGSLSTFPDLGVRPPGAFPRGPTHEQESAGTHSGRAGLGVRTGGGDVGVCLTPRSSLGGSSARSPTPSGVGSDGGRGRWAGGTDTGGCRRATRGSGSSV